MMSQHQLQPLTEQTQARLHLGPYICLVLMPCATARFAGGNSAANQLCSPAWVLRGGLCLYVVYKHIQETLE